MSTLNPLSISIDLTVAGRAIRLQFDDRRLRDDCRSLLGAPDEAPLSSSSVSSPLEIQIVSGKGPVKSPPPDATILEGFDEYTAWIDMSQQSGSLIAGPMSVGGSVKSLLARLFVLIIEARKGLVLHASCLVRKGQAFIFTGRSGAGKTTVCELSEGMKSLSDDLTGVLQLSDSFVTMGVPANGLWLAHRPVSEPVPLRSVFILHKAVANALIPLDKGKAVAGMLALPYGMSDAVRLSNRLAFLASLAEHVPCYELHFRKDRSFWNCIEANLDVPPL